MISARTMRFTTVAALLLAGSCTVVVPGPGSGPGPGGGPDGDYTPPPPKPVEADLLFVINLDQSSANMAPHYAGEFDTPGIADSLIEGLSLIGVNVTHWAVIPAYPPAGGGIRLLDGGGPGFSVPMIIQPGPGAPGGAPDGAAAPSNTSVTTTDVATQLQLLAATGNYDGPGSVSEAEGIVPVGQALDDAHLPPELGGIDGQAFFDRPRNLFVVVYLQPLARRCNLTDPQCQIGGRSPADIFTASAPDGTASWLHYASGGMPVQQIVHVAIATTEGESPDGFIQRCSGVNGFPKALLDVMEPSPTSYFKPLLAALNAANPGTGQSADLCDLLGELQPDSTVHPVMDRLVDSIAAMAGPAAAPDAGP